MTVADWIEGNCDPFEIITLEEAEPIIETEIWFALNEIEYQTGVQYDKEDFMSRLTDKEWLFKINNNDEPDEIDMLQAEEEIDNLMYKIIKEIKDEQEEAVSIRGLQSTGAKRPK
jgi:hypothetical protein